MRPRFEPRPEQQLKWPLLSYKPFFLNFNSHGLNPSDVQLEKGRKCGFLYFCEKIFRFIFKIRNIIFREILNFFLPIVVKQMLFPRLDVKHLDCRIALQIRLCSEFGKLDKFVHLSPPPPPPNGPLPKDTRGPSSSIDPHLVQRANKTTHTP